MNQRQTLQKRLGLRQTTTAPNPRNQSYGEKHERLCLSERVGGEGGVVSDGYEFVGFGGWWLVSLLWLGLCLFN